MFPPSPLVPVEPSPFAVLKKKPVSNIKNVTTYFLFTQASFFFFIFVPAIFFWVRTLLTEWKYFVVRVRFFPFGFLPHFYLLRVRPAPSVADLVDVPLVFP